MNIKFGLGERVYFKGDEINKRGFFEITEIIINQFGYYYELEELKRVGYYEGMRKLTIEQDEISEEYDGTGDHSFSTMRAYQNYVLKIRQHKQRTMV